jgi:hypothetical protein
MAIEMCEDIGRDEGRHECGRNRLMPNPSSKEEEKVCN